MGGSQALVDAYILFDMPGGAVLSLTPAGLVPGTVAYARGVAPFDFSGVLLDMALSPVPLGTYGVRAALTPTGSATPVSPPSQIAFTITP